MLVLIFKPALLCLSRHAVFFFVFFFIFFIFFLFSFYVCAMPFGPKAIILFFVLCILMATAHAAQRVRHVWLNLRSDSAHPYTVHIHINLYTTVQSSWCTIIIILWLVSYMSWEDEQCGKIDRVFWWGLYHPSRLIWHIQWNPDFRNVLYAKYHGDPYNYYHTFLYVYVMSYT